MNVLCQAWRVGLRTLALSDALLGVLAHATPTVMGQPWGHELTQRAADPAVRSERLPQACPDLGLPTMPSDTPRYFPLPSMKRN
jgi:hypothetical protein